MSARTQTLEWLNARIDELEATHGKMVEYRKAMCGEYEAIIEHERALIRELAEMLERARSEHWPWPTGLSRDISALLARPDVVAARGK